MRKKALTAYFWIIVIGTLYAAMIFFTDIAPECVSLKLFGMQCGACGVTRMLVSMAKLDFAAAFVYNPIFFVLFFVWNIIGVLCIIDKTEFIKKPRFLYSAMLISVAAVGIFGVIRNFLW